MLLIALLLSAHADPERPLARVDDELTTRVWYTVDGPPARPKWRNRKGRFTCTTWPDGLARRCIEAVSNEQHIDRRYDVAGMLAAEITLTEDRASAIEIHGAESTELDLSDWAQLALPDLVAWAPPGATLTEDGALEWRDVDRTVRLSRRPVADPVVLDESFRIGLQASCGCVLEDRQTASLGQRRGVRYRVRLPHPTAPRVGELWAVPLGTRLLVLISTVETDPDPRAVERALAPGRAVAALLQLTEAP